MKPRKPAAGMKKKFQFGVNTTQNQSGRLASIVDASRTTLAVSI